MLCDSSSIFETLPERPPTPPRDITKGVDDALRFLQDGHDETTIETPSPRSKGLPGTPPAQYPGSSLSTASATGKRVGFSVIHTYHDNLDTGKFSSPNNRLAQHTSTKRSPKPLRSILKPFQGATPLSPDDLETALASFSPEIPGSFRKMLNSVLQQLGSTTRSARLDAYLALNGALRTYNGIPDAEAMIDKGRLLAQFITRDMVSKDSEGRVDININTQALQLATTLLFNARTTLILDHDFRTMVLDRSIVVLEQQGMPKAIIKVHMVLLCQQRLYVSCLTASQAEKLVSALQTVQERCSGNSIIPARILIYHRLLEQAPGVMLNRMREWIKNVFHGLLSSAKDTRMRALETLVAAGARLGSKPQACKIVQEMFSKGVEEGQSYGEFVNQRLVEMLQDADAAAHAPQIWGAIISFFRDRKRPIGKWVEVNVWFPTIQQCLNRSDMTVKTQAHAAWNKLVFVVMPDSATQPVLRSMLKLPILAPFEMKESKHAEQLRRLALDSFCNLLHYALRPGLSYEEIDTAWDLYVDDVLSVMSRSGNTGKRFACAVLGGLFQKSDGAWNENAACATQAIAPPELRQLDPRWLRSRLSKILKVMEPILSAAMCETPVGANRSWKLMVAAIAEAGSQEVKISNELKEAIAQLTNFLRRLWNSRAERLSDTELSQWLSQYRLLVQTAITSLGLGHFTQDFLTVSSTDEVEAELTPANRVSKHAQAAQPAFVYLLGLYHQSTAAERTNPSLRNWPGWLLRLVSSTKTSRSTMIATLERSMHLCVKTNSDGGSPETHVQLWTTIAERLTEILDVQVGMSPSKDSHPMGATFHSAISVLQQGLSLGPAIEIYLDVVETTCAAICRSAVHHGGAGSLVLGVMEPFTKVMNGTETALSTAAMLHVGSVLLENHRWPQNKQELDQGRKALWPISLEPAKSTTFDPLNHFYTFIENIMQRAHDLGAPEDVSSRFLKSLVSFLQACPAPVLPTALRKTQRGLALWIEDISCKIFQLPVKNSSSVRLAVQVAECWPLILQIGGTLPLEGSQTLQTYEPLLVAGLCSPCKEIVNHSIEFWNSNFGSQEIHEYPSRLLSILKARREQAEIILPNIPANAENTCEVSLSKPQALQSFICKPAELLPAAMTPRIALLIKRPQQENVLIRQHLANRGLPCEEKLPRPSRAPRSITPVKLRHDDSQIDFTMIEPLRDDEDEDGSRLLTEHQKEVQVRQQEDAYVLPKMSSSPSRDSLKKFNKKINFAVDVVRVQSSHLPDTPTESTDGNPMSDDLPSSPTPRSETATPAPAVLNNQDEEDVDESEPPSSPPRRQDAQVPVKEAVQIPATAAEDDDTTIIAPEHVIKETTAQAREASVAWSDLPSDNILPEEQLRREAAAAEVAIAMKAVPPQSSSLEIAVDMDSQFSSTELPQSSDLNNDPCTTHASVRAENGNCSKLASSPYEMAENGDKCSSKKRKRGSFKPAKAAKKRNTRSPFNYLVSSLFGQRKEDEDEDDTEDEIIVASSASPMETRSSQPQAPIQANDHIAYQIKENKKKQKQDALGTSPTHDSEQLISPIYTAPATATQPKRGRGRPRKQPIEAAPAATAEASVHLPQQQQQKQGLKRRASWLEAKSTPVTKDDLLLSGAGSSKSRKTREGRDSQLVRNAQLSLEDLRSSRSTRSSVGFVDHHVAEQDDMSPDELDSVAEAEVEDSQQDATEADEDGTGKEEQDDDGDDDGSASTEKHPQSSSHRPISPSPRKILAPKGMLGQLRGILSSLKNRILNSQEEREFDNVLFEIRREVYEAGRRGRTEDE